MNVARLNLSHCSHDFAEKVVHRIRNLNKKLGTNVGIIVDTKGPEIRVGTFKDDAMVLNEGDTVILTPDKADGTGGRINISQRKLSLDLDIDTKILLDEGNMELIVTGIENANITCRVVRGGVLKNNKSINVPKVDLNIDFLSITFDEFKNTKFYKEIKYAPSIIIIKEGKIVTYLDPNSDNDFEKYQDADKLGEWIKNYVKVSESE